MPSLFAWLDTSSEEQRRVRDLIAMYSQSESRDELGVGQIRDAFSEQLFPGTSVIQTRARYFLFVPWTYRDGARTRSGARLKAWTDAQERQLILQLRDQLRVSAGEGLIGRVAGSSLKILPSSIYWSGLVRYGILVRDVPADQLGLMRGAHAEDELAERAGREWHPTLPDTPAGFPTSVEGLGLERHEAAWLRERVLATTGGTLLSHLLAGNALPDPASAAPWLDPACASASGATGELLHHAQLFSTAIQGAALLYNLLVAEQYEAAGHSALPDPVARYQEAYQAWAEGCGDLSAWDRPAFWQHVGPIGAPTRAFVDTWLDAVVTGAALVETPPDGLRALVGTRERRQKRQQSRLENARLLTSWSGASGTRQLDYRWGNVRRIVLDVQEGLAGAGA